MKISIITSVFNNEATIRDAIESVISQTYPDIEYIIIDGGSKDGTIEIIKEYSHVITHFISEPDRGIYDGLNKGLGLATGDIIGFLHSDDLYPDNTTISTIMQAFADNIDGVYGDLVYTSKNDISKILRYWKSKPFSPKLLKYGWMPAHPTLFLRRSIYQQHGLFDLHFKIAADYDFMLRILKSDLKIDYLPKILYKMRIGGESNKSLKNIIRKSQEDFHAIKKNRIGGIEILLLKNLTKIKQFIKKNYGEDK